MEIRKVKVSDLRPAEYNPRQGSSNPVTANTKKSLALSTNLGM